MQKARLVPDIISYNAAISASDKGVQWQQTQTVSFWLYFQRSQGESLQASIVCFTAFL